MKNKIKAERAARLTPPRLCASLLAVFPALWAGVALAQIQPAPAPPVNPNATTVRGPSAGGEAAPEAQFTVNSFKVQGDNPLSQKETDAVLSPFLGEQHGIAGLEAAADALEQAIRARGKSFSRVIVPAQKLQSGVVTLSVVQFKVGEVTVTGNRYYPREDILHGLPGLRPGETPDNDKLSSALAIGGEHPGHHVAVTMREGKEAETVDADVTVQDQKPLQAYATASNTGTPETGMDRLTLGMQHARAFGYDDTVGLSYTTSVEKPNKVAQYGGNFWLPLYNIGSTVSAYYIRSNANSGRVLAFDVTGSGEFGGVTFTHYLPRYGDYSQRVAVSLEDKLFNSGIGFEGQTISTSVRDRPFTLHYAGRFERPWGGVGFHVDRVANFPYAENAAYENSMSYQTARLGAARNWLLWRWGVDVEHTLGRNWSVAARASGQETNNRLIPGEQFGIGGIYSVRGFKERETAGDEGWQVTFEVLPPRLPYQVQPVLFLDAGRRRLLDALPGETPVEFASSIGTGFRWNWRQHLDVRLDFAEVLHGLTPDVRAPSGGTYSGKFYGNFTLFYRF